MSDAELVLTEAVGAASAGLYADVTSAQDGTPIGPLLLTVFACILEVFLLCVAGYVLAAKGILDKKTQKQLNHLNVSLFTPSLLFSKVAFFLSPAKLRELWIIPIVFVVVSALSMAVAYVLGTMFRLSRSQRAFAMAASMFMNSNSLPIALMQSLVVTVPSLQWGKDDNKNAMLGRALTYLVLHSSLGMVLRWSYGVKLLSQADDEPEQVHAHDDEREPLLPTTSSPSIAIHEEPQPNPQLTAEQSAAGALISVGAAASAVGSSQHLHGHHKRRQGKFYRSFPNSPNQSKINLLDGGSGSGSSTAVTGSPASSEGSLTDEEDNADAEPSKLPIITTTPPQDDQATASSATLPTFVPSPTASTSHSKKTHHTKPLRKRAWRRVRHTWHGFMEFMTAPLWAALASLIVACIRPVQHALEMHMQPVKGALTMSGNCSIPVTLIVLGAYFYTEPHPPDSLNGAASGAANGAAHGTAQDALRKARGQKDGWVKRVWRKVQSFIPGHRVGPGQTKKKGETKTVFVSVVSRMVITPILLLPLIAVSTLTDWHSVFEDPVFVVSNVLLISSPPALTLAQITQAASGDSFERLISGTIFWAYCIVTPPATIIYVVIGLVLAKL